MTAGGRELGGQTDGFDRVLIERLAAEGPRGAGTGVVALIPVFPEGIKAGDQDAWGCAPAQTRPRMRAKWLACDRLLTLSRRNRRHKWTLTVCSLI
jgi:hypothetical protein